MDLSPKPEWTDAARDLPDWDLAHKIDDKITDMQDFRPLKHLERLGLDATRPLHLLDFGAGMLRNTVWMLDRSPLWHVTAYDDRQMLERGKAIFAERLAPHLSRLTLISGMQWLTRYDAILSILVLQHIDAGPLDTICRTFAGLTDRLCLYGRRSLDDAVGDVMPIVLRYWEPVFTFLPDAAGEPDLLNGEHDDHFGGVFRPK